MRLPGFELGSVAWEATILTTILQTLPQSRGFLIYKATALLNRVFFYFLYRTQNLKTTHASGRKEADQLPQGCRGAPPLAGQFFLGVSSNEKILAKLELILFVRSKKGVLWRG